MNFYKHHIGDYAKKTAHLSIQEHGAYLLMLHTYYGTERPLPKGEVLYRMLRAVTKAERSAVDSIARQFWKETDTGFVNGRAFEEIESATQLVQVARQNGNLGGRPKRTQRVSESKAIQTPDSRLQCERADAPPAKAKSRATKRVPPDFTPDVQFALAELPDLDVETEIAKLRDWEFKTPRSDWAAVWRNWIRNAKATGKYAKRAGADSAWH